MWSFLVTTIVCMIPEAFVDADSTASGQYCTSSRRLLCFECDSDYEPACDDPFNLTSVLMHKTLRESRCEIGCCLKLTVRRNDSTQRVVRTCSSRENYAIDHQLLSPVCITEYEGEGKMCFCDETRCNAADTNLFFNHRTLCGAMTPILLLISYFMFVLTWHFEHIISVQ